MKNLRPHQPRYIAPPSYSIPHERERKMLRRILFAIFLMLCAAGIAMGLESCGYLFKEPRRVYVPDALHFETQEVKFLRGPAPTPDRTIRL